MESSYVQVPLEYANSELLHCMGLCLGWCECKEEPSDCDCKPSPTGEVKEDYLQFLKEFVELFKKETKINLATKNPHQHINLIKIYGKKYDIYHSAFKKFRKQINKVQETSV